MYDLLKQFFKIGKQMRNRKNMQDGKREIDRLREVTNAT